MALRGEASRHPATNIDKEPPMPTVLYLIGSLFFVAGSILTLAGR